MARSRTRTPASSTLEGGSELDQLVRDIHKKKGDLSIRTASQLPAFNHLPFGIFTLDFALMGGGLEGLAAMIYGNESSGKTTISDKWIAAAQKKYPDQKPALIDFESTFDGEWARKMGVDTDQLLLSQPENGEEGVDIIAALMDAAETSLIVVDSVPAMVPMKVLDQSAADATMGVLAQLCGRLCSKILGSWMKERKRGHRVTLLFTNQWRMRLGLVFGDPRTLPGGNQLNKYLVTTKIEIKNKEKMGKDRFDLDVVEVNEHSFNISKAKGGSSIRSGEFQMVVNPDHELPVGTFIEAETVLTYGKKFGFVTGGGASYRIRDIDQKFGNLREMSEFMYATPNEFLRLKQRIIAEQRVQKGLPPLPPDGFLLDWNAKENLGL